KANVAFAKTVEPANAALRAREREVDKLLAAREPTIPSTIGAEKAANPFLRADVPEVAKSVGLAGSPAWKVFAEIRERKNRRERDVIVSSCARWPLATTRHARVVAFPVNNRPETGNPSRRSFPAAAGWCFSKPKGSFRIVSRTRPQ